MRNGLALLLRRDCCCSLHSALCLALAFAFLNIAQGFAVGLAGQGHTALSAYSQHRVQRQPLSLNMQQSVQTSAPVTEPFPETFQEQETQPGLFFSKNSMLARNVLPKIPELSEWRNWYKSPPFLGNGHLQTILASQLRVTTGVCYARQLLDTPDGGKLALDVVTDVPETSDGTCKFFTDENPFAQDPRSSSSNQNHKFLLLAAGLGGGSEDTYVRSMAAAAFRRGWRVGVLNMRSCGKSPVTSPRFFSARNGATDDVRLALAHVREELRLLGHDPKVAVVGWSNGATILNNVLADQATTHAAGRSEYGAEVGVTLACPLDMPRCSANFERWFHGGVYDRAIARSLMDKMSKWTHLFQDADGNPKPVPAWAGGEFEVAPGLLRGEVATIRGIDEAITRRCFGFQTVDEYYEHASSGKRLPDVDVPLLLINAADDPIAYLGPAGATELPEAVRTNEHVMLALTREGGHLGWCERGDAWGSPRWIETVTLKFVEAVLSDA